MDSRTTSSSWMKGFNDTFARSAKDILAVDVAGKGMIVEVNNQVSEIFRLQHSLDLKHQMYSFLTWLRHDEMTLQGTLNSEGLLTTSVERNWSPSWSTRFASELHGKGGSKGHATLSTSYASESLGGNLSIERDRMDSSYVTTADATLRATENIVLGAQVQCDPERKKTGGDSWMQRLRSTTRAAFGAQYAHSLATATATVSTDGIVSAHCARRVCHYDKPGEDNVGLAAELLLNARTGASQVVLGTQFQLPNTKARVSTSINGSGAFKLCVQERLADWMLLRLTSDVDHRQPDFKFGIGIQIGPSAPKRPAGLNVLPVTRWAKGAAPYRMNKNWNP